MKQCPRCKEKKSSKDFKNQPYCRTCRALYNQQRRANSWDRLREYKKMASCKDCGNIDDRVLTFDPPQKVVSNAANGASWAKILEAAEAADVVCANCLCIRQYKRGTGKR